MPPACQDARHQLRSALSLARPFDEALPQIRLTSARTGEGVDALCEAMLGVVGSARHSDAERQAYFFDRWIGDEWGNVGRRFAGTVPDGPAGILAATGGFDAAQSWFSAHIPGWLSR